MNMNMNSGGIGRAGGPGGGSNWISNGTGQGGGSRHHIHMMGLPFRATQTLLI